MMTLNEFSKRASGLLLAKPPKGWSCSDDDMNLKARMIPEGIVPKPAAVLVGVFEREGQPVVLLTQRTASLSKHAGQIALPGGRMDVGETAVQAAVREAHEETGLDPALVQPLGYLDGYLTVTGYFVVPVVATIGAGHRFTPQIDEVAEIFDVPLAFFLDANNRETHSRAWNGLQRQYYVYPFGRRYIWGATAGMLKNLADRFAHAEA